MIKLSTAVREALAVGGSLKSILDGGLVRIYSGSVPASADAAIGGATLLCEISVGGDGTPVTFEATAPLGVLKKSVSETWTGTNLADGSPSFFRYVLDGDDGSASASAPRFQGSAGVLGSDMYISSLPLVTGQPLAFSVFELAVPEQ